MISVDSRIAAAIIAAPIRIGIELPEPTVRRAGTIPLILALSFYGDWNTRPVCFAFLLDFLREDLLRHASGRFVVRRSARAATALRPGSNLCNDTAKKGGPQAAFLVRVIQFTFHVENFTCVRTVRPSCRRRGRRVRRRRRDNDGRRLRRRRTRRGGVVIGIDAAEATRVATISDCSALCCSVLRKPVFG